MPRIPQAQFSQGMSLAVDAPTVSTAPTGDQRMQQAGEQALGVVTKIQDMRERTQAYEYSQKVRSEYDQIRLRFEDGLANSDADGNYQTVDQNDNPVTRNINEDFMQMEKVYSDGIKNAGNIWRGDIAGEVINKDIGDELIRTNIRTSRVMANKKTKVLKESSLDDIQRYLSEPLKAQANGENVSTSLANSLNKLDTRLAGMKEILGDEDYAQLVKVRNSTLSSYASEMIQGKATAGNIAAADKMLDGISDENDRFMAKYRFERIKKNAVEVTQTAAIGRYQSALEDFKKDPVSSPKALLDLQKATRDLQGLYTNPKYGGATQEQLREVQDEGLAIMAGTVSFRELTKSPALVSFLKGETPPPEAPMPTMAQTREEYVTLEASRGPSGEDEIAPRSADPQSEVMAAIDQNLKTLGVPEERRAMVGARALKEMGKMYATGSFDLSSMVEAEMPGATRGEMVTEIVNRTKNLRKDLGPLVSEKYGKQWLDEYKSRLTQSPGEALVMLERQDLEMGGKGVGPKAYNYKLMQDIVGKNRDYSYLSFLSVTPTKFREAVVNAKREESLNEDLLKLHGDKIKNAEAKVADTIEKRLGTYLPAQLKEGMVQSIRALGIQMGRKDNNFDAGMERAMEMISENAVLTGNEKVSVFIPNGKSATNYAKSAGAIKQAMHTFNTLPMKSYDEKKQILEKMGFDPRGRSNMQIDAILDKAVKIVPDTEHPGVHVAVTVDSYGTPHRLLDSKKNRIAINAEEMIEYSQRYVESQQAERQNRGKLGVR